MSARWIRFAGLYIYASASLRCGMPSPRGRDSRRATIGERFLMSRAGYEYTLRLAPRIDRVLIPLTRGWFSSLGLNRAGFLVTTGAKSGTTRTNPIVFIRHGDELLAIGSNYGRSVHPSWSANLIAHPECQVYFRGPRTTYRAELQTGIDRDRIWETVLDYSVAYARYAEKAAPRQIRVFRLVRKT